MIAYTFWEIYYVEELEHTWGEQHKNRTNLKVITQHVHLDFLNNISANENTNLTHYSCSISWIGLDLMKTHIYTEVNVDSHGGCEKKEQWVLGEIRGEIPPLLKTKTPTSHRQLMLTVRGILGTHIGKFSLEKKNTVRRGKNPAALMGVVIDERRHWWKQSATSRSTKIPEHRREISMFNFPWKRALGNRCFATRLKFTLKVQSFPSPEDENTSSQGKSGAPWVENGNQWSVKGQFTSENRSPSLFACFEKASKWKSHSRRIWVLP